MIINLLLFAALCVTAGIGIYGNWKTYCRVDELLNCVLRREMIQESGVREGAFSALASKISRIQDILEKQAEGARAEKEQVKSLVSNMSHQFKTPLANLMLYTDILCGSGLEQAQRDAVSRKIKKQVEKLDWMTGSLAKMAKLEQGVQEFEAEALPLGQTILDAADAVYDQIDQKGLQFLLHPYEDCMLYHNRKWTAEVFVNILENAVKYTESGGRIQIFVRRFELYTEIQFVDDGCGIPQDEQIQIFQRFYRGRGTQNMEGCGIGLYLSQLILEKEKGYVTVKSAPGEGSCFSVFLQNCKN